MKPRRDDISASFFYRFFFIFQAKLASWAPPGGLLASSWRHLEASWRRLGASWDHLGGTLGRLAASWRVLEASWHHFGLQEPSRKTCLSKGTGSAFICIYFPEVCGWPRAFQDMWENLIAPLARWLRSPKRLKSL